MISASLCFSLMLSQKEREKRKTSAMRGAVTILKTDFYPFHKLFGSSCGQVLVMFLPFWGLLWRNWVLCIFTSVDWCTFNKLNMSQKHQIVYMRSKILYSIDAIRCLCGSKESHYALKLSTCAQALAQNGLFSHQLLFYQLHFLGDAFLSIYLSITYEIYQVNSEFAGLPSTMSL